VSTYASSRQPFEHLQAVLDLHAISTVTGLCLTCGVRGPCAALYEALNDMNVWRHLPRRRVGATQPELIDGRRLNRPRSPRT
jgi:hypothetical protein